MTAIVLRANNLCKCHVTVCACASHPDTMRVQKEGEIHTNRDRKRCGFLVR